MASALDNLTLHIADRIAKATWRDVPDDAARHILRSFVNFIGCGVGGAQHEAVERARQALSFGQSQEGSAILGLPTSQNTMLTALLTGISSSVYAFDDTHAQAIVHPSSPVGSAVLALAVHSPNRISGQELLLAFGLGIEIVCRLSKAISVPPARGDIGWQQSGITGAVGAAVACSKLLGLDAGHCASAMGIAASLAGGLRIAHGTMAMHLLPAHAASIGVEAALLAQADFTGPVNALEGRHGFLSLFAKEACGTALSEGLTERWELLANTFKPYPCGVVIHPVIDACLQIRSENTFDPAQIAEIELWVNEAAVALANRAHPRTLTEAQVSVQHWAAAALLDGKAGIAQGFPDVLFSPNIASLRSRCRVLVSPLIAPDAADVRVTFVDGSALTCSVGHCVGSLGRPLGDDEISQKFLSQCGAILGDDNARTLLRKCWSLPAMEDIGDLSSPSRKRDYQ
jgi:2-methylcitrate dehydratase PrpD